MMTEAELGVLIEAKLAAHVRGTRPVHPRDSSLGPGLQDPMPIESYVALLRILGKRDRQQLAALTDQQRDICFRLRIGLGDFWRIAVQPAPDEEAAERNLSY